MEEFEEIAQMDEELEGFLEGWGDRLTGLNGLLLDRLYGYVDLIDTAAPVSLSLMLLMRIRTEVPGFLASTDYGTLVGDLLEKMDTSLETVGRYLARVYPDSGADILRMKSEIRMAAQSVRAYLLGAGIEATYISPIEAVLQQHILTRSTKAEFRRSLRELLVREGLSTKAVSTYASDALYQFSRSYTLNVSESVGARYFYYMGGRIKTTRGFCNSRLGRAYPKKEVEGWAALKWAGRIPGTTAQSIFWYVGGYNCRHRLLPVSKAMYLYINNQMAT
ncbi:hypothetical protein [Salmonirosea aquatica]|uniref:Uncharacterized protein n=1 Tax=Salmonirosea aquatica TaxID=2654236 RepID=A0A7C9BMU9_9BACT|nr:hypothetical protein [Cytophagaceae bacterium SJW1-29]